MADSRGNIPPPSQGRARARGRITSAEFLEQLERGTLQNLSSDAASTTAEPPSEAGSVSVASGSDVGPPIIAHGARDDLDARGLRVTLKPEFNKVGEGGEVFPALTNYFYMNKTPNFTLYQYRVDFSPEEDSTVFKKLLVRSQEQYIGSYIFDGHMLYTTRPIPNEMRDLKAYSKRNEEEDGEPVSFSILIKPVGTVLPTSPTFLQFYNMVMRKCMTLVGMEELGRHFYDRHAAIKFKDDRLELWPGIISAIRNHDVGTLLCVEVTHKVLRMSDVWELISVMKTKCRNPEELEKICKKELIGTIVMTHYNRRTYKIDDIDFTVTPTSAFRHQDGVMTRYIDYYLKRYNIQNIPETQPMLVSIPKKKDVNKGVTGNIYLIPSLCNPTGLTDDMRKNFTLMRKLSNHLHMGPDSRKTKLDEFIGKIKNTQSVKDEFQKWDIDFYPEYVSVECRKYPSEPVFMGPVGSSPISGYTNADWSRQLKGRGMLLAQELKNWIVFVPDRDSADIDQLVKQLKMAATSINVNVVQPLAIIQYNHTRMLSRIRDELNRRGEDIKFVFVVLTNNNVHNYADIKKLCILDFAVGCQCFLAKNMNSPKAKAKLSSICTKVMIQINAKLGGVPWGVKIPVKRLMILGFDVYHCSERKNQSAGALVSTTDQALTKYYSTVTFHQDKSELAKNLTGGVRESLEAFRIENDGALPDRIFLYRDGVGEGQINYVLDIEIPQIRLAIETLYKTSCQEKARLSVIIVTKKINSRVLLERGRQLYDNVPPGTVVDNTFTLPERYDFFLVSQSVNQGTVSPTNYNVVCDDSGFRPEQMQKLSFKLCHNYYNWCGTVAVPAPCQYAHKLAYLTGIALNEKAPLSLATTLWYL
ncbi:unnamed protein product [Orchesella dallaii]|uniref:Piwi-like protein 1 n=1 Tax=Orchesella dallaii TaxID=48710 RepID=A0ABP1PXE4_9HEXA